MAFQCLKQLVVTILVITINLAIGSESISIYKKTQKINNSVLPLMDINKTKNEHTCDL